MLRVPSKAEGSPFSKGLLVEEGDVEDRAVAIPNILGRKEFRLASTFKYPYKSCMYSRRSPTIGARGSEILAK